MNAALFNAVTLKVDSYGSWSESDVLSNGAKFDYAGPLSDLEELLNKPRRHDVRFTQTLLAIEAANAIFYNRIYRL